MAPLDECSKIKKITTEHNIFEIGVNGSFHFYSLASDAKDFRKTF